MVTMLSRWTFVAGSLGIILVLAGVVWADGFGDQPDNALDRARRQMQIAAQKTELEVRIALREAERLARKDRAKAVERLKKALAALEDDTALSETRRQRLIRMLKDRIRVTELPPAQGTDKNSKRPEEAVRRAEVKRKLEEQKKIQLSLQDIRDLQRAGKNDEARRKARELARQHPNSPAAQSAVQQLSILDQLASARRGLRDRRSREDKIFRGIDDTAIPPVGDITIDRKRSELARKSPFRKTVRITPKERAILKALDTPVSVTFKDSHFEDVIEYLATLINQPILLDKEALKDAEVNYDSPVTLSIKNVSVRTVLRHILGDFGLAYIIKDQSILVTSKEKARKTMVTRVYPIGDLVIGGGPFGALAGLQFGPAVGDLQLAQNVATVIDLIKSSVDPDSWKDNGGVGTIVFNAASMSLIVRQSAEVHSMLAGSLGR